MAVFPFPACLTVVPYFHSSPISLSQNISKTAAKDNVLCPNDYSKSIDTALRLSTDAVNTRNNVPEVPGVDTTQPNWPVLVDELSVLMPFFCLELDPYKLFLQFIEPEVTFNVRTVWSQEPLRCTFTPLSASLDDVFDLLDAQITSSNILSVWHVTEEGVHPLATDRALGWWVRFVTGQANPQCFVIPDDYDQQKLKEESIELVDSVSRRQSLADEVPAYRHMRASQFSLDPCEGEGVGFGTRSMRWSTSDVSNDENVGISMHSSTSFSD